MAISNKERQKKWREKNGARINFERRQKRKNLSAVTDCGERRGRTSNDAGLKTQGTATGGSRDSKTTRDACSHSSDVAAQTPPKSKIEELRELVRVEQEKPHVEAPVPIKRVYRSETGMVITREQWEEREAEKNKARLKGFEIDEYSQA